MNRLAPIIDFDRFDTVEKNLFGFSFIRLICVRYELVKDEFCAEIIIAINKILVKYVEVFWQDS